MKVTFETDANEVAIDSAIAELRRVKKSYDNCAMIRVERKEMTADAAYAKVLPIIVAMNVLQAVSLAMAEPEPEAGERTEAGGHRTSDGGQRTGTGGRLGEAALEDAPVCCLCGAGGLPRNGEWQCSNKGCPRCNFPMGLERFTGNF